MFCTKCGNQVAAGERFCTKCGAPIDGAMPAAPDVPAPAPVQAKPSASKGPIVVIVVALIVIAAAVAVLVVNLLPVGGDASQSASSSRTSRSAASSSVSSSASEEADDGSPGEGESVSASAESVASPSTPAQSDRTADGAGIVSDTEAYQSMNLFLSNFSEVDMQDMPSVSDADVDQLARFALSHDAINSSNLIEAAPSSSTPTNGAGNKLGSRESAERLNELLDRYLGTTADFGSLPGNSPYVYSGGYVYFTGADVQRKPVGVVNVTGSEKLTGGRVKVYFDVYGSSGGYDATDEDLYALSPEDLMERLGCTAPAYSGTAVVQTGGSNETTGGLTLVSYERER